MGVVTSGKITTPFRRHTPTSRGERTMNTLTETLARATLRGPGGAFPAKAGCPDFPLVSSFYLDEAPSDADVKDFIEKLKEFPEARSVAVPANAKSKKTLRRIKWEVTEDLNAMKRIKRVEVDSVAELKALSDEATLTPFALDAPLWDAIVVTRKSAGTPWDGDAEGYPEPPVVLVRMSHAVGDGIALVDVLKKVSTSLDGGNMRLLDFQRRKRAARSVLATVWAFITFIFVCIYGTLKALLTAMGPYDSKTAFKGVQSPFTFSGKRTVVVCPPVPMEDIKAVKDASGCTVNDVVVAALAGAIQGYLSKVGDKSASKKPFIRAACPYAFPDRVVGALTNSWTFISLTFPMGVMSAKQRLIKAQKACNFMKRSPEPYVTRSVNEVVAAAGPNVQRQIVFDYMSRHSMVFTNVPGPTEPIRFMNHRVRDIIFACSNIVNQVSVLSYAGSLRLTLVVDPDVTPKASIIGNLFKKEIEAMRSEL